MRTRQKNERVNIDRKGDPNDSRWGMVVNKTPSAYTNFVGIV